MSDSLARAEESFPATATASERLRCLVNYAVLAPSGHSTQPWLFEIDDHSLKLIADRTRALPVVDPHDRALVISCGATAAFLNQPVEVDELRPRLKHAIGTPFIPQLLMRFGYGPAVPPTVRRPIDDVLV